MLKKLVIAFSVLATTACTTVQHVPLTNDVSQKLQGESLSVTTYSTPSFTAMTAGKAMFGAIGGVAMVAAGNSIIKENDIQDPARKIGQHLAEKLVAAHGMRLVDDTNKTAEDDKVETLVTTYPDSKFLLDVGT